MSKKSFTSLPRCLALSALLSVVGVAALQSGASAAATPSLSIYASAGWYAGTPITASVNLNNGVNPTGWITYSLYGPADQTCSGVPLFTTATPVQGNGYYSSASFTTNAAGTYHWVAVYSGDSDNYASALTACDNPNATVYVATRNVTLNSKATPVSASGTISATATIGMGSGPSGPTGSLTFTLYGPNVTLCATPIFSSVEPVNAGNGTYTSDAFRPTLPGKYQWKVSYSGDANNSAAATSCYDALNHVTLGAISTGPSLTAGPASVKAGGQVTVSWSGLIYPSPYDWAALYPVNGRTVVAWRYTGGTAAGTLSLTVPATTAPGSYEVRMRNMESAVIMVY